jgi:hypothetical protein
MAFQRDGHDCVVSEVDWLLTLLGFVPWQGTVRGDLRIFANQVTNYECPKANQSVKRISESQINNHRSPYYYKQVGYSSVSYSFWSDVGIGRVKAEEVFHGCA